MRKRLLIGLLTIGVFFQSFSMSVLTVRGEEITAPAVVDENVSQEESTPWDEEDKQPIQEPEDMPSEEPEEYPSEEPEGIPTEEPEENPSEEPVETPSETPIETPSSIPTETPDEQPTETPSTIPEPEETPSGEPTTLPTGLPTETPSEIPEEFMPSPEETPSGSPKATSSASAVPSVTPVLEDEELIQSAEEKMGCMDSSEGLYQEGSFQVLGGDEDAAAYASRINNRAEAEEFLYQQLLARKGTINLSKYGISTEEIGPFVYGVINEHPELYYVKSPFWYYYSGSKATKILVKYNNNYDSAAFNRAVEDALSIIDDGMTDLEKAIALHEYLILNCEYDYANYLNGTLPTESYSAYGILVNRTGVCQGYALTYKLLLERAGIECYMVSSSEMNHAWNLINLDGEYYQVDTTWDDPVWDSLGRVMHTNMFLSDAEFGKSHYGWSVTRGSINVDLTADDSRYDDAFWVDCRAPLVLEKRNCYYINPGTDAVYKRNFISGEETVLASNLWSGSSNYYTGLFLIGERLYYNTSSRIYSIPLEGGEPRVETDILASSNQYIHGSAYCQGQVRYTIYPNASGGRETILTAQLLQEITIPVNKIKLEPGAVIMSEGESALISASIYPSYAQAQEIVWSSDNEAVAVVEDGRVTAVEGGNCIITASAGGRSAQCRVRVREKLPLPVFVPGEGTIDKGDRVALYAEQDAVIYYTVNGSEPVISNKKTTKKYESPIVVNKDMTIKAIAITASDEYDNSDVASAEYKVCTNNLLLDKEAVTLTAGYTEELGIKELPTTRTAKDVIWESSDEKIVTINDEGKLTAVFEGEAVITASVKDHQGRTVTAECRITVEPPVYQVTFAGFNKKPAKIEQVKARRDASAPQITAPAGYRFTGWKGDYSNILQDTVIEAQYKLLTYTISYEPDGGKNDKDNPGSYTVETESIDLIPADGKEGYLFTGWYLDKNCEGNSVSVIEKGSHGDITLYAGWKDERGLWLQSEETDESNIIPNQPYTGKAVKPAVKVYYGDKPLEAGRDYTISYKNNVAANHLETEAEQKKPPMVVVKGKGNYTGTITKEFVIERKNIADIDVQADDLVVAYNKGKAIKPVPVIKWNGKKLANKRDFTVEYPDEADSENAYREAGTYTVVVTGRGNYMGRREIPFTITASDEKLMAKVRISKIPAQIYTGEQVALGEEILKLTFSGEQLSFGTDYELAYAEGSNGTSIGTHEIIITGKGKFKGVRRVNFKIQGASVKTMVIGKLPQLVYNGEEQVLDPNAEADAVNKLTITDKEGNPLTENVDYTLSFNNNQNVGTAKMTVTGIGKYTGKVTKAFKIIPKPVDEGNSDITAVFANDSNSQPYEKGGAKPKVKVSFNGRVLEEGIDYTLSYANNTSINPMAGKEPAVTIKGKKNFKGSRKLTFSIGKKDISDLIISAPDLEENKKSGKYMSVPVLTDKNGKKLKAGTDYEKSFDYTDENGRVLDKTDRPLAGSQLTVTVTGKGNYEGEISTGFRIIAQGRNISKAKVKLNRSIYYTGENITLAKKDLTITFGKNSPLTENEYEIIGYSNNRKKGTAKVIIRGKGEYGGTKQVSFRILPQMMAWWEKEENGDNQ